MEDTGTTIRYMDENVKEKDEREKVKRNGLKKKVRDGVVSEFGLRTSPRRGCPSFATHDSSPSQLPGPANSTRQESDVDTGG